MSVRLAYEDNASFQSVHGALEAGNKFRDLAGDRCRRSDIGL